MCHGLAAPQRDRPLGCCIVFPGQGFGRQRGKFGSHRFRGVGICWVIVMMCRTPLGSRIDWLYDRYSYIRFGRVLLPIDRAGGSDGAAWASGSGSSVVLTHCGTICWRVESAPFARTRSLPETTRWRDRTGEFGGQRLQGVRDRGREVAEDHPCRRSRSDRPGRSVLPGHAVHRNNAAPLSHHERRCREEDPGDESVAFFRVLQCRGSDIVGVKRIRPATDVGR